MKQLWIWGLIIVSMSLQSSRAEIWGDWIASGTSCNVNNVHVLENGGTLAVLFDEFGINMPTANFGDGTNVRKTCIFRIKMTPPNGYYLANLKQLYSGGLIKSTGSSAQLNIRYNIGPIAGSPLPIVWPTGVGISAASPNAVFQKTYMNNFAVANCGRSTSYGVSMQFLASRTNLSQHFVGGLDSIDTQFTKRLELVPEWALCP